MLVVVLLAAATGFSQQPPGAASPALPVPTRLSATISERDVPLTKSDLYCAGFVSSQALPRNHFIGAGLETPLQSRYTEHSYVFLRGGGYIPGTRLSVVREVADFNHYSPFPAAGNLLAKTGKVYRDIGYLVVKEIRGTGTAVGELEFACEEALPGDLVVPFVAKQPVAYRERSRLGLFPAAAAKVSGKIVAARDFMSYLSAGQKIYVTAGERQGIKPGDYLRIVRDYRPSSLEQTDAATFEASMIDDTQQHAPQMPKNELKELPRRVLGEALVLSTHPGTATAMITFSLEPAQLGDIVELEEPEKE
jgi:hypothetical protein